MKKKIVVIGGGTGSFITLSGLKKYPYELSAIVTMMDDGGSTGKLRDQLGVLPPGDLRQCLIALSDAPDIWRKLFNYRFESGDLEGHSFGNILLSALEKVTSSYDETVEEAHKIMAVQGKVIPVTHDKSRIHVEYQSGRVVEGEKFLDERSLDGDKIKNISLVPNATLNPKVIGAIEEADYIIVGPGDLYSSIISISAVEGFKKVFEVSKAKIIFIMNLMTKSSQTPGYSAQDHIDDFARYFGRQPNYVMINSEDIPKDVVEYYRTESNDIVVEGSVKNIKLIKKSLLSPILSNKKSLHDQVFAHSVIRHDPEKVATAIVEVVG